MIKHSNIGKFAIRLTLVAYVIVIVASLFGVASSFSEQKSALVTKSLVKGISLIINEEKEKEADEHQVFVEFSSITSSFITIDTSTQMRQATSFVYALNATKIFLRFCSLQI